MISLSYHYYIVDLVNGINGDSVDIGLIVTDAIRSDLGDNWQSLVDEPVMNREVESGDGSLVATASGILKLYPTLLWWAVSGKFDAVHIQQDYKSVLLLPALAMFKLRHQIVFTWHEPTRRNTQTGLRRIIFPVLGFGISLLQDEIVVHGSILKNRTVGAHRFVYADDVHVVPYHTITVLRNFVPKRNSISNIDVLFFGGVRRDKGVETLIEAGNELTDVKIVIAGPCKDEYRQTLEATIESENIRLMTDYLESSRVAELFKATDMVALPYTVATQSSVLHIAYGFGCPVIVSDVGALAEDVTSRSGIVVSSRSVEELKNAIQTITADISTFEFGAEQIADDLDAENIQQLYYNIYAQKVDG